MSGQYAGRVADRDTEIMEALGVAWARVRAEAPLGAVPAADFYLTEGRSTWCATATWAEPVVLRINLMHEGRNRTGEDIMESLLHLGGHAMSRGSRSPTQGEGRYHSAEFRDAAKVLGLDAERVEGKGFGFGEVSMARATKTRYRSEISKLDRALARWEAVPIRAKSRAPIPLVCQCTPDTIAAGLENRGLPANTGLGTRGTQAIAAPKRIIAPTGVAARGGLRCDDCGSEFVPAD
jgi:hypothetical protein